VADINRFLALARESVFIRGRLFKVESLKLRESFESNWLNPAPICSGSLKATPNWDDLGMYPLKPTPIWDGYRRGGVEMIW
jgi:hypothetical protein